MRDKKRRQEMRQRLVAWGLPSADIERCMRQVRERQTMKHLGQLPPDAPLCTLAVHVRALRRQPGVTSAGAAVLRLGDDYETPDDTSYRPAHHDAVLTGVARATGATARAVKTRKTITKHQYMQREEADEQRPR